ncbi:hypothetical protein DFP72DRAFT_875170 [Ephemerocybe angulata]|uniref:Uncharacterized protein n=1 Tax=Ephemerocybe angulata TaxID=980116 RepID=A0A8H6MCC3_9AGAR|nr:hypothetical protein DFP72DRAFT_875170 [Tulosesus angulatus]
MRLPLELVEAIVEHLGDDLSALKSCSTASSVFLPSSQRHLFSTLTLSPPRAAKGSIGQPASSTTEKALQLFSLSPHLTKYIHTIFLENAGEMTTTAQGQRNYWLTLDAHFPSLISLIPAVRSFVWENGMCGLNWFSLPVETRQAMHSAFGRWPLVRFEVSTVVNFPLSLVRSMKSLAHLGFAQAHFVLDEAGPSSESGGAMVRQEKKLLSLKTISLAEPSRHLISALVSWLLESADVTGLEGLSWNTYYGYFAKGEDMMELQRLLRPASSSIRALHVAPTLDGTSVSLAPSLALPSQDYTELRTLTMGFEFSQHNPSSFHWLKNSLENVASRENSKLETVQFRCHLAQGDPLAEFDESAWSSIRDTLLSESAELKLPSLREVSVEVYAVYSEAEEKMEGVLERIREVLGPLEKRVSLRVTRFS